MARIYGTIESLNSLKTELEDKGITRFNSIGQIKDFIKNYNYERENIYNDIKIKLDKEYSEKCFDNEQRIQNRAEIINLETENKDNKISDLLKKIALIQNDKSKNVLKKLFLNVRLYPLKYRSKRLIKSKAEHIRAIVKDISRKIEIDGVFINRYENKRQQLIEQRAKAKIEKLEYTREVVENSKNLISGAIGENLVVKEIKKLSDDYVLINDFNLNFSDPIYFKKYNQRIKSIQIDHLLITKAGIFIIETKNWSKSSVNSRNLRSPIEQIERSNFALYIHVSESIILNEHHWGEQKIPIRNLIVMINHRPAENFKYVSVKLLKELNNYIKYFDPILTEDQVNRITTQLI
ncbi:nuclease-related domain-containing protein [Winogradskyella sp. 4-2091]|uniref:nuclease-related domain-containing protein n=1 Tax=Winogradskyella sp. 4-2091 TaxID=3381659 RepID=UPI00389162F3